MTTNAELLAPVTDLVPFLRWRIDACSADELAVPDLIEDPGRLAAAIAAGADGAPPLDRIAAVRRAVPDDARKTIELLDATFKGSPAACGGRRATGTGKLCTD